MTEDKKLRILSAISLNDAQVERIKAIDARIELHWYARKDATRIPVEIWREAEILLTMARLCPLLSTLLPEVDTTEFRWCRRKLPQGSPSARRLTTYQRQRNDGEPDGRVCDDGAADAWA